MSDKVYSSSLYFTEILFLSDFFYEKMKFFFALTCVLETKAPREVRFVAS